MYKPKKIFLIEDDADEQLFFTMAIKEIDSKLKYTSACNGQEALNKLKIQNALPDIIFLDLEMPVMNGYTFLSEIRKDIKLKDIPVVVLTSLQDYTIAERTRKLGARAFLTKPVNLSLLQTKLHYFLNFDFSPINQKSPQLFFTELSA
jgi:CheY-like chemotaxis protein